MTTLPVRVRPRTVTADPLSLIGTSTAPSSIFTGLTLLRDGRLPTRPRQIMYAEILERVMAEAGAMLGREPGGPGRSRDLIFNTRCRWVAVDREYEAAMREAPSWPCRLAEARSLANSSL